MPNANADIHAEGEELSKRQGHVATPMSWAISILIHVGVLLIASLITWASCEPPMTDRSSCFQTRMRPQIWKRYRC